MAKPIIVVGSANTDLVIHAPKMPLLGETLTGGEFAVNAGGKGLNQAVAVAKLGGAAAFLGAVGDDANGQVLLETLEENGVAFCGITVERSTGVAMITVVDGNNCIVLDAGANQALTPAVIERHAHDIAAADFCVMQLEVPLETVAAVCAIAQQHGTKIVLNPAPFCPLPASLLDKIDYLIPNEHEAREFVGFPLDSEDACKQAVERLLKTGVKTAIITLGERGCVYNRGEDIVFCPARQTTAVDTTSAGDCFIGALTAKLSQHASLDEAIVFATKASAIAVSRKGASKSIPFANEIE